jgi:hypothetical protein
MPKKGKPVLPIVAVIAVLVAIIVVWRISHKPANPLVPTATTNIADFDQFQQDLASRVLKQFGADSDFSVIVATAAYPPGTLLRATGSIPADSLDCAPSALPKPFPAPRLFPSYTMSTSTALTANLGSHAISGLNSAGVDLQQSQNVQYTIADTEIEIMDDKTVDQITRQGNCGSYISSHPGMRLIRGAVNGKMTFTVKVNNPASVKAQLEKIGGFSLNDNPQSSTLSIADLQSGPIVLLLSEFAASSNALAPVPTPQPLQTAPLAERSPASVEGKPHMFVQMDKRDNESSGMSVVQLLRAQWPSANVESKVERIPSQKMPDNAQIRYFNDSDAEIAKRCGSIMNQAYPNTRVVRIGLPSPKGQLEVWLPKAAPAPVG